MSDIPPGWEWAELSDVCTSITDGDHQPPPQTSLGIPFLVIGNMRERRLDFNNCRYVPDEYFQSIKSVRRPRRGDVLYSLVGATYGFAVPVIDDRAFCVQRHIGILRPSPKVSTAFLAHVLNSREVYGQASNCVTGTAQPTVPLSGLRRIRIPLPPRLEQDRIVAAIEEQFSRLDAGIEALSSTRRRSKQMRSAVLEAAVKGRFTNNDDTWSVLPLSEVADVSGGIIKNPKRSPLANSCSFLRVANVLRDKLDLTEIHRIELFPGDLERYSLRRGDLLIVEGNGSPDQIGRSAIWNGSIEPCVHQNHLIRARPREGVVPEYLNIFWNTPSTKAKVQAAASSTSGLHTLSTGKVRKVEVALPSLKQQRLIVEEVERKLSAISDIDHMLDAVDARSRNLRQSILTAAFSGDLT